MSENNDVPGTQELIQVMHASRDELISLKVSIASKRLIVALCENDRGRFIKLTDGRSRILVPSDGISKMREAFASLEANNDISSTASQQHSDDHHSPIPSHHQSQPHHQTSHHQEASTSSVDGHRNDNGPHKSELIDSQRFLCEGRKFYFDILENSRGPYLKISQASNRRITLIVPVAFLPHIKIAVDMVLEKAPPDTSIPTDPNVVQRATRTVERVTALNDGTPVEMNAVQREVRVMGKKIIFESAANRRGGYLKIMENNGPSRMTIVLPHSAVPDVIQLLEEAVADGDPAEGLNINTDVQNGQ